MDAGKAERGLEMPSRPCGYRRGSFHTFSCRDAGPRSSVSFVYKSTPYGEGRSGDRLR